MANPSNPGQPQWGQPPAAQGYPPQGQQPQAHPGQQPQAHPGQPPAAQGYPPQPQAHPGQQPQAHPGQPAGQPYAHPSHAAPVAAGHSGARTGRRSTALPITVAAGLAVGVFVGLLIVKGTGKKAPAGDQKPLAGKVVTDAGVAAAPTGPFDAAAAKVVTAPMTLDAAPLKVTAAPIDAAPVKVAIIPVDAATAAVVTPPTPPTPPTPASTTVQLTLEVVGPAAAVQRGVKLKVNGKTITEPTVSIELKDGKKRVKVTASAKGYYYSKRLTLRADAKLEVKLWKLRRKKPSGSSASDLIKLGP